MYKVRTAKSEFTGTCGHRITPGNRFVVVEQRPQFHCEKCGKAEIAKAYRAQIADLSGKDKAEAKAEAEEERP
jgi:predicted RNA-binding Zn-ribbon protein involved in translation (DUF1610 family)